MGQYTIKQGDTLSHIALEFYGDGKAANRLAKFNKIPNPDNIKAGDTISIPERLFTFDRFEEKTPQKSVITGDFNALCYPIIFYYQLGDKKEVARRRFIYCWHKDMEKGWQDIGVLMTDDWGRAHCVGNIVEKYYADKKVVLAAQKIDEREPAESKPFGFYDAKIINEFEFFTDEIASPRFTIGEEYAFMFAPLDSIQASDSPLNDARGVETPPAYKSNKYTDVDKFESQGELVRVTLPKAEDIEAVYTIENGKKHLINCRVINVTVPFTLPEYISLMKQYTQHLDAALHRDAQIKKAYMKPVALLNEIDFVLDLMEKHPKKVLDPETTDMIIQFAEDPNAYNDGEKEALSVYRAKLGIFTDYIEENYLQTVTDYITEAFVTDETNPAIVHRTPDQYAQMTIKDLAQVIFHIFADKTFDEKLLQYLEELKLADFQPSALNFFSFKHPLVTITDAFLDTCMAISMIPDPKIVEEFYENEIRPLETACIEAFDDLDKSDESKGKLIEKIDDMYAVFGTRTKEVGAAVSKPTESIWKVDKTSKLKEFFNTVTNGRVTGFWNNQDGAPSMMTRILGAYARNRGQLLRNNPQKLLEVSVVQLKIYMAQLRFYFKPKGVNFDDLYEYFKWKSFMKTSHSYEMQNRSRDLLKKIEKAPEIVSKSLSSLQMVASVVGIVTFVNKETHGVSDYVDFTNSICNAGLAFSGVFPKEWARIAGKASVTATGKALTGVGFFCTAYTASIASIEHEKYGENDLCTLETFRFYLAMIGGGAWTVALIVGLAGAGPVGWVVFLGLLAADIIQAVIENSKFGTQNFVKKSLKQIDESPLLWDEYNKIVEIPSHMPGGPIHSEDDYLFKYIASKYKRFYKYTFKGVLSRPDHENYRNRTWEFLRNYAHLPFRALYPEKTVKILAQRNWPLEDLIDLHHDGFLTSRYSDVVQMNRNLRPPNPNIIHGVVVKKLYNELQNKSDGQDSNEYYVSMLKGSTK